MDHIPRAQRPWARAFCLLVNHDNVVRSFQHLFLLRYCQWVPAAVAWLCIVALDCQCSDA